MADLTQTAANVNGHVGFKTSNIVYGETVVAGNAVYKKATDSKYWKAINSAAADATAVGIALTGGAADEPGVIQISGPVDLGATLTIGEQYYVSNTAGAIAPAADIGTGEFPFLLGIASAADKLEIKLFGTGVAHA